MDFMTHRELSNLPVPNALSSGSHRYTSLLRGSDRRFGPSRCVCKNIRSRVRSRPADRRLFDSSDLGVKRYRRSAPPLKYGFLRLLLSLSTVPSTSCSPARPAMVRHLAKLVGPKHQQPDLPRPAAPQIRTGSIPCAPAPKRPRAPTARCGPRAASAAPPPTPSPPRRHFAV